MEKRKKVKQKLKQISASWFSFTHDTLTLCRYIQNLTTLALVEAEKSVTKHFIGDKNEKWTNIRND